MWGGGRAGVSKVKSRSRRYSNHLQPIPEEAGARRQEKLPERIFQRVPKAGAMGPLTTPEAGIPLTTPP